MNEDIHSVKAERTNALEDQFLSPELSIAGAPLHPFTAGRKLLLKALGNELLSGKELSTMSDADFAVIEFLYLHTLPPKDASIAVYGNRDKWRERVVEFACECTPSMDVEVQAVMAILRKSQLADVSVETKPTPIGSGTSDPTPPPN